MNKVIYTDNNGMEVSQYSMQEIVGRMAKQMAEAKEAILRKAIAKHLGVAVVAPEHLKEIEIVKWGKTQEWLLHQGKTFGYLITERSDPFMDAGSSYRINETLTFVEANSKKIDQMIADQKYQELQARMAEEMRQVKIWSAAMQAIEPILHDDSISKQDEPIAIVKRLWELGFRLEMEGAKQW